MSRVKIEDLKPAAKDLDLKEMKKLYGGELGNQGETIGTGSPGSGIGGGNTREARILLLQMPWATVQRPSIALGILSSICREKNVAVKTLYPNMDMAHLLGFKDAHRFARESMLYGVSEHLFATDIFGAEKLCSNEYITRVIRFAREFRSKLYGDAMIPEWGIPFDDPSYFIKIRDEIIPGFLDRLLKRVLDFDPTVVGFSATFNQVMPGLALGNRLKKIRPEVLIIAGGASYDGEMGKEYHRALPHILDNVFIGEGETSFREFLRRLKTGENMNGIPGVTSFNTHGIEFVPGTILKDLNESPIPDYDDFISEAERMQQETGKVFNIQYLAFEGSRGCWWGSKSQCLFCGLNPGIFEYRSKKAERIVSDIINLSARYRCTALDATDLVMPIQHSDELFELLKKLDLDIDLFYEVRVTMTKKQVKDMFEAGIKTVQPGIESFSTPVLKIMRKGTTSLKNIQFLRWVSEIGIKPHYNILAGFPGEKEEWYVKMAELIRHITHLRTPQSNLRGIEMHRFSPFYEKRDVYGVDECDLRFDYRMNFPEGLVDPLKIGYFFNVKYSNGDLKSRPYDAVREEIDKWICLHREHRQPIFQYQIGPGFIKISDTRFEEGRFVHLSGLHHDVFLLCDEIQTRAGLRKCLARNWPAEAASGELDLVIDELVQNDILIEEGSQLLALPVGETFRDTDELRNYVLKGCSH
jgi:ribosomal peptide maturation radical SAM protein 1